jgi:hypothetical protein
VRWGKINALGGLNMPSVVLWAPEFKKAVGEVEDSEWKVLSKELKGEEVQTKGSGRKSVLCLTSSGIVEGDLITVT